jgi:c-di-AMP phosphodiesterase-like protein
MKPSTSDYLSISAALLAILLCGFGIGFLVGERITLHRAGSSIIPEHARSEWAAETVGRLTRELKLDETQVNAVQQEVDTAAREIATARSAAIHDYYRALLELHLRLLRYLDPNQRQAVEESYRELKLSLDKLGSDAK